MSFETDIQNPHLKRQIKKYLGEEALSSDMVDFLKAIQNTYEQNTRDREFLEFTMDVSLKENLEINEQLKGDIKIRNKTIKELYDALEVLDADNETDEPAEDILSIANRLKQEITKAKTAEEQRRKSETIVRTVIDSALDSVIVIDESGAITEWNNQAAITFGWTREEALGKKLGETIIPERYREAHQRGMTHFLSSGEGPVLNQRIELPAIKKNGEEFPVELTIIPSKIDGKYMFSSYIRDLTESKKSERALKAINDLARSLLGKNSLTEIAWQITKSTAPEIGLEDCVIYILDEDTGYLHQVAAHGKKNPEGFEIYNSIVLRLGQGIVGTAAEKGEVILVNDTSKHPGYLVDDEIRLSELAVPIIENGKVIGVIDTEHPEKEYYTQEHVDMLTTIANIASAQMKIALETGKREKAEANLKESEERWQNLVLNQPEALQISKNGKVVYLNPAGLKLYEAESLDQMINYDLFKFAGKEIKDKMNERLERLMKDGHVEPLEFRIHTLKGNERFIEANSTRVTYNGALAIQTILRDITEKKKAEDELVEISSRLTTLLDNLSSGVLMEDPDRVIVHTNQRFAELFGNVFNPEDLYGSNCALLLDNAKFAFKDPEEFVERVNKLVQSKETVLNEQLELANGKFFERDFIPIYHGKKYMGNVWQYRDVTEKIEAERELLRALESERSYNELNSNFVSMVSHEFRTPLTSIHSTAELLIQFGDRFKGEELKKRVQRIYNSSIKMDTLIRDVPTIGKLDSDNTKVDYKEFRLSDVLNDMIGALSATVLHERDVVVESENADTVISLDINLIELILRNLLENAGKYSQAPDKILVNYSIRDGMLNLSCQDFGIGIPKSDQSTIFESFKRGSNTENIKGTGLGLPIVKKSVERLNGTINLESEQNKGTKITISIPVKQ